MFVDSNEKQVAVLGGGYLQNYIATGSFEDTFCVVTDKRVYFTGKCFYKYGNSYKSSTERKIVDLKDITGTGFVVLRYWWLKIMAIMCVVIGIIIYLFFSEKEISQFESYQSGTWFVVIICGLLFGILYFLLKQRLFEISYAGGVISFKASGYSEAEMQSFHKELRKAKDNVVLLFDNHR